MICQIYHCRYVFPFTAFTICMLNRCNETCQRVFHSTTNFGYQSAVNTYWRLFPVGKAVVVWPWPITSIEFRDQEWPELWLHSPICLHGVHKDYFYFLKNRKFSSTSLNWCCEGQDAAPYLKQSHDDSTNLLRSEPLRWPNSSDRRSTAIAFYTPQVFFFLCCCLRFNEDPPLEVHWLIHHCFASVRFPL